MYRKIGGSTSHEIAVSAEWSLELELGAEKKEKRMHRGRKRKEERERWRGRGKKNKEREGSAALRTQTYEFVLLACCILYDVRRPEQGPGREAPSALGYTLTASTELSAGKKKEACLLTCIPLISAYPLFFFFFLIQGS